MGKTMLATFNPGAVVLDQLIPNTRDGGNHPHAVDFYVPPSYNKALVCLHGGLGAKESLAQNLRIITGSTPSHDAVRWSAFNKLECLAVVPQGQHCTDGNAGPWNPNGVDTETLLRPQGTATWSNRNMWSGADDPQFLKDLRTYIDANYPAPKVAICGHSNGGMMVNRVWYEDQARFTHYCTVSGPAPYYFASQATPVTGAPFFAQVGEQDEVLGIKDGVAGDGDHFYSASWSSQPAQLSVADVNYPNAGLYVPELAQLQTRLTAIGGGTVDDADKRLRPSLVGNRTDWIYFLGKIHLRRLSAAAHDLTSHQTANGSVLALWATFVDQN